MKTRMLISPIPRTADVQQRGFTLVELMVSITIGMLIVAALLALYVNVSRTNNEMAKANRQIENGRFAIQLLQDDFLHAGFWGDARPPVPTMMPDPCLGGDSWDDGYKAHLLAIPVMGYSSDTVPGACVTGAQANSDVVVVRHANTCRAGSSGCEGGGPHIQVSGCTTAFPREPAYLIDTDPAKLTLRERDCATIAARRKVVSNIYFVRDNTLVRSSLADDSYVTQPMIEGIEAMRIEYGIDDDGDGSPDGSYRQCTPATCSVADLSNVVAVTIHVLARNLEGTPGHADNKSYQLGATEIGPFNDNVKRHVFSTAVRLVNPSGRREAPPAAATGSEGEGEAEEEVTP